MAKRKKRWKRKGVTSARAKMTPMRDMVVLPKRGRPAQKEIGPTEQTVANQKPDTLKELLRLDLITKQQMMAGENVLRAWRIRTSEVDNRTRQPGYSEHDSDTSERLQLTWVKWCGRRAGELPPDELYRRCSVRPDVIVGYITDYAFIGWGADAGALGVLKRALDWWAAAEGEVGKALAADKRRAEQIGGMAA